MNVFRSEPFLMSRRPLAPACSTLSLTERSDEPAFLPALSYLMRSRKWALDLRAWSFAPRRLSMLYLACAPCWRAMRAVPCLRR